MNPFHRQALEYVQNSNGGASLENFVEDFEPIGKQLWGEIREYVTIRGDGKIVLSKAGENQMSENPGKT